MARVFVATRFAIRVLASVTSLSPTFASAQSDIVSSNRAPIKMLTGDSWQQGENVFKLYGVQSCIRGTYYTDHAGVKRDCGDVAAIYLAALMKDAGPKCTPVATLKFGSASLDTTLVVCRLDIRGNVLDLGSVVISQGFGTAAMTSEGGVVYPPYAALEDVARVSRIGLWSFSNFPHPHNVLSGRGEP